MVFIFLFVYRMGARVGFTCISGSRSLGCCAVLQQPLGGLLHATGAHQLPDALERALGHPTLLRVWSLVLFFSVRFLRYMRTVSPSYAKQSSLVVYAGERHGAQSHQSGVSVGTGKVA